MVGGKIQSAVILTGEFMKSGEIIRINERKEVEKEMMTLLSKRFFLTCKNTTMESYYTS